MNDLVWSTGKATCEYRKSKLGETARISGDVARVSSEEMIHRLLNRLSTYRMKTSCLALPRT